MSTKIWPKVAGLLLVFVFAMPSMANTIYSYSAIGTANPVTTGTDPFGNQWQISEFFGNAVFSIPGMPSLMAGSGPCQWAGPECLVGLTVTIWEQTQGGDQKLNPENSFLPSSFQNVTGGVSFTATNGVHSNFVTFTAPNSAAVVNTGEFVRAFVFSNLPAPGNLIRYDITYETAPCDTPEPGTYALVGGALAVVSLWKRRGRMYRHPGERATTGEPPVQPENLGGEKVEPFNRDRFPPLF